MKAGYQLVVLLYLLLPSLRMEAQAILGARAIALGQSATALHGFDWAIFSNPAMMDQEKGSVSFYGIRYYGFSEITDIAAEVTHPTSLGTFGAGVHRYGFELFNESRIRVAYKNEFQRFYFGAAVNYSHVSQGGGYGSAGSWGVDLGLGASVLDRIWIGARATNINQPSYGKIGEELPREMAIGLSYLLSDKALFISEVVKDVRFPIACRSGVEVTIVSGFRGRAGVTTNPTTFSGGLGYLARFWQVNIAAQTHQDLGISPGLDFSISW